MKLDFFVSHNCTQRENKMQEKNRACAEYTSGQKGPTRAYIAQRPVADAQNILPDRERG